MIEEEAIVFRSLKKRTHDKRGRKKKPQFRTVPVPSRLIEDIDLVFNLRTLQRKSKTRALPLWTLGRTSAWRMVKKVMQRASIEGPQATAKGLRHGFGIHMIQSSVPITVVRDLMGHTDTKTTEIYLQAVGEEQRAMVMQAWG